MPRLREWVYVCYPSNQPRQDTFTITNKPDVAWHLTQLVASTVSGSIPKSWWSRAIKSSLANPVAVAAAAVSKATRSPSLPSQQSWTLVDRSRGLVKSCCSAGKVFSVLLLRRRTDCLG